MIEMLEEVVILVDKHDKKLGVLEKLKAHEGKGLKHRAISVLLCNSQRQVLFQKRAKEKYHCPGLWANTCCGHPRPGESNIDAAYRRLNEEMGIVGCELTEIFPIIYEVQFGNGLSENEYDHVFIGEYNGDPKPNPKEVADWAWLDLQDLKNKMFSEKEKYTYWSRIIINNIGSHFEYL